PPSRHLQSRHGSRGQRAQERQCAVADGKFSLPDRQQQVDQVGISVMKRVRRAGGPQRARARDGRHACGFAAGAKRRHRLLRNRWSATLSSSAGEFLPIGPANPDPSTLPAGIKTMASRLQLSYFPIRWEKKSPWSRKAVASESELPLNAIR